MSQPNSTRISAVLIAFLLSRKMRGPQTRKSRTVTVFSGQRWRKSGSFWASCCGCLISGSGAVSSANEYVSLLGIEALLCFVGWQRRDLLIKNQFLIAAEVDGDDNPVGGIAGFSAPVLAVARSSFA